MKYTREDVIIWTDDERLEGAIGKECWFDDNADGVLKQALKNAPPLKLRMIYKDGFEDCYGGNFPFLILKKKEKVVPFDFSLKEDRDALMGKRICSVNTPSYEVMVTEIVNEGIYLPHNTTCLESLHLMYQFVFADTGKPVGKEVEE